MTAAIPPKTMINVFDATKDAEGFVELDITSSIDMDRAAVVKYLKVPMGQNISQVVPEGKNAAYFVVLGGGVLHKAKSSAELAQTDCFTFLANQTSASFEIAAGDDGISILVILTDKSEKQKASVITEFPTIVSGQKTAKWKSKGIDTTRCAFMAKTTDIGLQEKAPWGLNLEHTPPGTQTSNAHAHMLEDEFVLVLSGKARYWHQGETSEHLIGPGDAVGWKAGTGLCHTLLNDAEDEQGSGTEFVFLVWGLDLEGEKCHYATASPQWWSDNYRWWDVPKLPVGPAHPLPHYPRSSDAPYPPGEVDTTWKPPVFP